MLHTPLCVAAGLTSHGRLGMGRHEDENPIKEPRSYGLAWVEIGKCNRYNRSPNSESFETRRVPRLLYYESRATER